LIIDRSHGSWIVLSVAGSVAALCVYVWLDRSTPGGVTGGSLPGLLYAVAGSALMIFAGLLAAHRKLLRWAWVPRRSWWLKGHIWLGLLSFVFIFCHARLGWGGVFERILWMVFGLVLITGVIGVVLQHVLPRRLLTTLSAETPYEQIPHACRLLRRQADALATRIAGESAPGSSFHRFYEDKVRPFLSETYHRSSRLARAAQAGMEFAWAYAAPGLSAAREDLQRLQLLCDERRQLGEQQRLHHWLHVWLILHVPLSLALLILGVTHALVTLYY
jgi:hypothetical protein